MICLLQSPRWLLDLFNCMFRVVCRLSRCTSAFSCLSSTVWGFFVLRFVPLQGPLVHSKHQNYIPERYSAAPLGSSSNDDVPTSSYNRRLVPPHDAVPSSPKTSIQPSPDFLTIHGLVYTPLKSVRLHPRCTHGTEYGLCLETTLWSRDVNLSIFVMKRRHGSDGDKNVRR